MGMVRRGESAPFQQETTLPAPPTQVSPGFRRSGSRTQYTIEGRAGGTHSQTNVVRLAREARAAPEIFSPGREGVGVASGPGRPRLRARRAAGGARRRDPKRLRTGKLTPYGAA